MSPEAILLGLAFVVSLAWHVIDNRAQRQERERLTDALVARTAGEFAGLRAVESSQKPKREHREPIEQVGA